MVLAEVYCRYRGIPEIGVGKPLEADRQRPVTEATVPWNGVKGLAPQDPATPKVCIAPSREDPPGPIFHLYSFIFSLK